MTNKRHLHKLTEDDTVKETPTNAWKRNNHILQKELHVVVILIKMQEQKIIIYCSRVVISSERVKILPLGYFLSSSG